MQAKTIVYAIIILKSAVYDLKFLFSTKKGNKRRVNKEVSA